jgi:nicotinamide-nucleotide amidase
MIAEIITIGDELLIGQIVNSNAAWLGEQLSGVGVPVRFMTTVGDDAGDIRACLSVAVKRADVIIATGGLGPTHDDVTKKVVADFFEAGPMRLDPKVLAHVQEIFKRRNRSMVRINEEQALVPAAAQVLWNKIGTAPGLLFEKDGKYCAVLPGVPVEMKNLVNESVLPFLRPRAGGTVIRHRTIKTHGIAESTLAEKLAPIADIERFGRLASLPGYYGVNLRVSVTGQNAEEVQQRLAEAEKLILARAAKHVYGFDEETIEEVIGRRLRERQETLSVAESCTGGLIANRLTNISGSSDYFLRGYVTYSNEAKIELLGVSREIIEQHGAVSEACARAMAGGAREKSGATYGLATTGIAGPTGGTPGKPVGLVWVALATPEAVTAKHIVFTNDRLVNKERFSQFAFGMLYQALQASNSP